MPERVVLDGIYPPFGPSLYWALDAGNQAVDLSGNGRSGTAAGGLTLGGSSDAPPGLNGSTDFDGTDDRVTTTYTTRRNLCTNPSFETNTTGWTVFTGSFASVTGTQSTTWSAVGTGSVRLQATKDATATLREFLYFNPGSGTSGAPVTPSTAYTLSFRVNVVDATNLGVRAYVIWYTAAGATISQAGGTTVTTTGESEVSYSATSPSNAAFAAIAVSVQSSTSGDTLDMYVDRVLFEAASSQGAYFDGTGYFNTVGGTFTSDSGGQVGWLGTAHASASDKGALANGTVRSFAGWAYRDTSTSADTLVGANTSTFAFALSSGSGQANLTLNGYVASVNWANAWPGNAQWVHWALTFNEPTDTAELFINGASQGTKTLATQFAVSGSFQIAATGANDFFDGKQSAVAVYERGLTNGEIGALYELGAREYNRRPELDITPWIAEDGVDWGDAAIEAYMAEQRVGGAVVDYTIPNRQASMPLVIKDQGGTTFAAARTAIQAKAGLWQQRGGRIKRVIAGGGTVWADVVAADLKLSGSWLQSHMSADTGAGLVLETLPDWYGQEVALTDRTETSAAELIFTESTSGGGDFPLGDRVRIVVDEDDADTQRGLIWALRGRHHSAATTAAVAYEAEALANLDTATKVAKVGASGGTVVTHGTISTSWTPVVGTNIGGSTFLTHTGTYQVFARVFSTSGTAVDARWVYDVGDLVNPVENDAVNLHNGGTFHILDLGQMRLDPAPTGPHRWQGQVQARGQVGTEAFSVDRLWFANQDESAGVLQAPVNLVQGAVAFSARSEFNTESGAITGDTLAVGGVWTDSGSNDSDDFSVAGGVATRTSVTDTGPWPRLVHASTPTLTNTAIRVDLQTTDVTNACNMGFVLRRADANNFYVVYLQFAGGVVDIVDGWRLASSDFAGATRAGNFAAVTPSRFYTFAIVVVGSDVHAFFGEQGSPQHIVSWGVPELASSLTSGKAGLFDSRPGGVAATRTYDNFASWAPTPDAVLFASQSTELATTGITREDSGGTAFGPVSIVNGDLPRFPNRSSGGTVGVLLKASRGDLQFDSDPGIDDISARVYRTPSWLRVG